MNSTPSRSLTPTLAIVSALALVGVLAGVMIPTETWATWFEHPIRTHHRGGVPAETTLLGARAWRLALVAGSMVAGMLAVAILRGGRQDGAADARGAETHRAPRILAGLMALIALALAIRLPRLDESLWYDEIAAFLSFSQFGAGPTMGNYFTQSNHVLYGILSWIAVMIAGHANEVVLRLPALVASLACVPAMWWVGREAVVAVDVDRAAPASSTTRAIVPWAAALIAAIAPVWVLEVEARGYVFMMLGAALSTALWLRAARVDSARCRLLYAVVIALSAWAHLVSIGIALGHGAICAGNLVRRRPGARGQFLSLLLAAALTVMLYAPILPDMLAIRSEFQALDGNEPTLFGPEGLHAAYQLGGAWWWWAALPGLILAVLGAGAARGSPSARRAVVAALAGVPIVVVLSWIGDSWLYARFLLFALPGAALLIAFGFATVVRRGGVPVGTIAAFVVAIPWLLDLTLRPPKQPLREAVMEVAEGRRSDEGVVAIGLPDPVLMWYGLQREIAIVPTAPLGSDLDAFLATPAGRDAGWVILLYPRSVAPERFATLAREGFELLTRHRGWVDWDNGDVMVFRRRLRAAS